MACIAPFEARTTRYEHWFMRHRAAYESEVNALKELVPREGRGLEIGVGTARFAEPLGIRFGIDPSLAMLRHAAPRGVAAACGVAESLPFREGVFDHVLIVTTVCFVDDARAMLLEARRALNPEGAAVVGFIDRTSALGRRCDAHRQERVFYRDATFYSAEDVCGLPADAGFGGFVWRQTLTRSLRGTLAIDASFPGFGTDACVAVRAVKR